MYRIVFFGLDRSALVNRISGHVEHTAHDALTDRHFHRATRIDNVEPSLETFSAGH